jgi:hypothetical protein
LVFAATLLNRFPVARPALGTGVNFCVKIKNSEGLTDLAAKWSALKIVELKRLFWP